MNPSAVEQVVADLEREHHDVLDRLAKLKAELAAVEARRADIENVRAGLERLGAVTVERSTISDTDRAYAQAQRTDGGSSVGRDAVAAEPATPVQRIRSTELVAQLVARAGAPMTRDEIVDRFGEEIGFPETWQNPRNAIGNALARATSRGLIASLDGDRFAGKEFELL
ncbi:hypothetical protein [Nocardioides zeae]